MMETKTKVWLGITLLAAYLIASALLIIIELRDKSEAPKKAEDYDGEGVDISSEGPAAKDGKRNGGEGSFQEEGFQKDRETLVLKEKEPVDQDSDLVETADTIKKRIIRGEDVDIPSWMNTTREMIVKEHLYGCYVVGDVDESIDCYDQYYLNNDAGLLRRKESCNNETACLDDFYLSLAEAATDRYCQAIIDEEVREKCISEIV